MTPRPITALVAAVAPVAAAGLLLLGSATAQHARAGGSSAVEIVDFAFSPQALTIMVGDTVTWTNADPVVHTATSTSGAFDSGDLDQGESYSVTFTVPGTYDYLCTPHPQMTGSIVVEAAPATAAPTPAPTVAPPGGGPLPNVAVPVSSWPVPQLAGVALLMLSAVAAVLTLRKHRAG